MFFRLIKKQKKNILSFLCFPVAPIKSHPTFDMSCFSSSWGDVTSTSPREKLVGQSRR